MNQSNPEFYKILGSVFASREIATEIGYPVYNEPDYEWIVNKYGFVSYVDKKQFIHFLYDYVYPKQRGKGHYKNLFSQREKLCKGNLCRIETRNEKLKVFLIRNDYKIIKQNGSWTYFQKQL